MGNIKVLRDYNGTAVYPQTVTSAIFSSDNQTLDSILSNKAEASESYSKNEINDMFAAFSSLDIVIVETLPTTEISTTSIYLLKVGDEKNNNYEEYLYINGVWEMIGTTEIDLSGYVTKNSLASVATSGNFNELNNKPEITTQNIVTNFWYGTQEEYNALATKESTKLYLII